MIQIFAISLGGAVGAVLRFLTARLVMSVPGMPNVLTGTFFSNLVGSFFSGMAMAWLGVGTLVQTEIILFLTTGMLGSLTTFSAFALEADGLFKKDDLRPFAGYLFLQLVVVFIAAVSGFMLVQTLGGGNA